MHVVLLSGSPAARSRTEVLLDYVRGRLEAQHVEMSLLRVRDSPLRTCCRSAPWRTR